MSITTCTEEREDCPIIKAHCIHFSYQCDSNGEVAISHCCHPKNHSDYEGNCTNALCPLMPPTTEALYKCAKLIKIHQRLIKELRRITVETTNCGTVNLINKLCDKAEKEND